MDVKVERGQCVCTIDGENLGKVARVERDSFVVETGSPNVALVCRLGDIVDVRNGGIQVSQAIQSTAARRDQAWSNRW